MPADRRSLSLPAATVATVLVTAANLRASWAALPWLAGIAVGAWAWRSERVAVAAPKPEAGRFSWGALLAVMAAAAATRLWRPAEFPLGPYIDDLFNLRHSLGLLERPFDLFGHSPLVEGLAARANLYGYLDLLSFRALGVGPWSLKLPSAVPGIVAAAAVYLAAGAVSGPRAALAVGLLFAFGHWPVRLGRCGWDVSFTVAGFAAALWLLALALRRGRPLLAYASGLAAGLSVFSYLGGWVCLASLCLFLALEVLLRREPSASRHAAAFAAGAALAAFPLACRWSFDPALSSARLSGLSVFNEPRPFAAIAESLWRHALMFHASGGAYARDNYPGLPMLDPLTGLALLGGLHGLVRDRGGPLSRLLACAFIVNLAGGVFSASQEGPPYVYRTSAAMVPAFLIAGLGIQRLLERGPSIRAAAWVALPAACLLNLYLYFGLEARNLAAMRVMAYEPRLIGLEIARGEGTVLVVGRDSSTAAPETSPKPGERHVRANPAMALGPALRRLAVIALSGRYDLSRSFADNFSRPRGIEFVEPGYLEAGDPGPCKVIFRSADGSSRETISRRWPGSEFREIRNALGEPSLTVASL